MPGVQIENLDQSLPADLRVRVCRTFWSRFRGLMFHPPFGQQGGILLVGKRDSRSDSAIHMFFMRMDLAVIWIDSEYRVVDVQLARRWRPVYTPAAPARYILEVAPTWLDGFQVGDQLRFEYEN